MKILFTQSQQSSPKFSLKEYGIRYVTSIHYKLVIQPQQNKTQQNHVHVL